MKKVLITGFEAFGKDKTNPTFDALMHLKKEQQLSSDNNLFIEILPVVRYESIDIVVKSIIKYQPDIILTIGQASGRKAITPERIAINLDDFRIPDNQGNQPIDEKIFKNGPDAYFSSLPIKAIIKTLRENEIPSDISNTAGTFVCNHLFYGIQHYIKTNNYNIQHGFIHVPLTPKQNANGNEPTMSLDLIIKGLKLIIQTSRNYTEDVSFSTGQIC